jgi:hypothetical protein
MEMSNVSEQQAEQTHGEDGSIGAAEAVQASTPGASTPVAVALTNGPVDAPAIAPDHEAPPKEDSIKEDAPKIERTIIEGRSEERSEGEPEAPNIAAITETEAPIVVSQADAAKLNASFMSGRLLVKTPGRRGWQGAEAGATAEAEPRPSVLSQPRRQSGMAAVVALAVLAGGVSGALATIGVMRFAVIDSAVANGSPAVETSVARIDADIVALKAGLEHAGKTGLSQFNKTNDRLDKIEKAQAEPAARLAKLSEAVDRLRTPQASAAPAAQAAAVPPPAREITAARDITGSVPPATSVASVVSTPAAPPSPPKPEVARLPTVEGWTLRDVSRGGALIEGRKGLYEVYAGDPVPGLGRVDAIRKQDGRWVVVTTKGLVVAR